MKHIVPFLIVASLFLPPGAADSNWQIDDLTGQTLGNGAETVFVVNLSTKEGDPLTPDNLDSNSREQYYYNATDKSQSLQNLYSSYWFARERPTDNTGSFVRYEAKGDAVDLLNADQEANTTTNYKVGNLTPVILTNTSERFEPGQRTEFKAFFKNSSGDNVSNNLNVFLNITNFRTGEENEFEMVSGSSEVFSNSQVEIFDGFNSSFYLEIFANKTETNKVGEASSIIRTLPELDGELRSLESEKCSSGSFPDDCQPNSTLTPFVSVTQSEANVVNATLLSGDDSEILSSQELQLNQQGKYTGTIRVPLVNTSQATENMTLRINGSNQDQSFSETHQFNYSAFELVDNTPRGPYSSDPVVESEVRRPETRSAVPPENLSGNFTVVNPSGQVVKDISLVDMEYEAGQYVEPVDANEEGEYATLFEVEDQFGANRSIGETFVYEPSSATFDAPLEKEVERNKTGQVPFSFEIDNNRDEALELRFNVSGELSENLSVNSGQNATLGPENQTEVGFNLSGPDLFEGDSLIEISENLTDFSRQVDLNVDSECAGSDSKVIRDDLCHNRPNVDTTVDNNFTEFDVKYVGDYNSTQSYQFNITGNASEIASLSNNSMTIGGDYSNDSATLNLSYNPQTSGFYSGNITSDTGDGAVVQSDLDLTAEEQNASLDAEAPNSVDIGVIPSGGNRDVDVEINNTGEVILEVVNASSETFNVAVYSSEAISVGESRNVTLTFSDVSSTSGDVIIEFRGGGSQIEEQLSGSAETIPDYNERVPQLIDTADTKERESSSPTPELGDARTQLRDARSEYNQGNYEQAKELFTDAKNTINEFEPSDGAETDEDSGGADTTDTEDTNTGDTNPTETTNGSGGGSGGLLLAGIVLLVFLVIGFVLATSIELEPGDPLYEVLGE